MPYVPALPYHYYFNALLVAPTLPLRWASDVPFPATILATNAFLKLAIGSRTKKPRSQTELCESSGATRCCVRHKYRAGD